MNTFYNGTRIRSMLDRNKKIPAIVIVDGNRGTGKTTDFNSFLFEQWKETHEEVIILQRFKNEIKGTSESFFNKVLKFDSEKYIITEIPRRRGDYAEIQINGEIFGYCLAINASGKVKKYGGIFKNVTSMIFDEFQNEFDEYAPHEVIKFQSLYNTIARCEGKITKLIKVYMLSNGIDVYNPYYEAMGINENLLRTNMNFYRGDGFVIEHNYNEAVANVIKETPFNRAFSESVYTKFLSEKHSYLKDRRNLIGDLNLETKKYWFTLKYLGELYGIYKSEKEIAITEKVDKTYKKIYVWEKIDYDINTTVLPGRYYSQLLNKFDSGRIVCENGKCQRIILRIT